MIGICDIHLHALEQHQLPKWILQLAQVLAELAAVVRLAHQSPVRARARMRGVIVDSWIAHPADRGRVVLKVFERLGRMREERIDHRAIGFIAGDRGHILPRELRTVGTASGGHQVVVRNPADPAGPSSGATDVFHLLEQDHAQTGGGRHDRRRHSCRFGAHHHNVRVGGRLVTCHVPAFFVCRAVGRPISIQSSAVRKSEATGKT